MAHPGGRPLKFDSPAEIEALANDYFKVTPSNQWTITGLALALDTNRETLMNYEARDEFFDTIKKLKAKIEHAYELHGMKTGGSFDIFRLKNMGWKDKQEVEHSGGEDPISLLLGKYGLSEGTNNDRKTDESIQSSSESHPQS